MIVEIPLLSEHNGYDGNKGLFEISDKCPVCGGKRGEPSKGISYDGSRRIQVDVWRNECGHIDKYSAVRIEGVRVPYPRTNLTPFTEAKENK